ncbi:hypothetical protein [Cupriavidus necator]
MLNAARVANNRHGAFFVVKRVVLEPERRKAVREEALELRIAAQNAVRARAGRVILKQAGRRG